MTFQRILILITDDRFTFSAFQIGFCILVLVAFVKDKQFLRRIRRRVFGPPSLEVSASVKRGEESWNAFLLAHGIASVSFIGIIASTSAFSHHKSFFMLTNLLVLLYLFFFNAWFRNKILSLISKAKTLEEKL